MIYRPQLALCVMQYILENSKLLIKKGFIEDMDNLSERYIFPREHLIMNNEETRILVLSIDLIDVRGSPFRDPRKNDVSILYKVEESKDTEPLTADNAKITQ